MLTKDNLDKKICDIYGFGDNEETLREYIKDTEQEFQLTPKNLNKLTDEELKAYVDELDHYWNTFMKTSQELDIKEIMRKIL